MQRRLVRQREVPVLLALAAAVILGTVAALLVLEAYLLASGRQPITWYSECAAGAYPLWTFAVVAIVTGGLAALGAHFFWSHSSPVPPRPL